jgi:hypothetical protein
LTNTGGAIGQGLPVALGAAIACPGRRVVALVSDGSTQYTVQTLWSLAHEQLPVVVLVAANHQYAILRNELRRGGAALSEAAAAMTSLADPCIDWVGLAQAHGGAPNTTRYGDWGNMWGAGMPAPFIVLGALLIRGLSLPGAGDGIRALMTVRARGARAARGQMGRAMDAARARVRPAVQAGRQPQAVIDRGRRVQELAAVRETIGRDVDDSHHPGLRQVNLEAGGLPKHGAWWSKKRGCEAPYGCVGPAC